MKHTTSPEDQERIDSFIELVPKRRPITLDDEDEEQGDGEGAPMSEDDEEPRDSFGGESGSDYSWDPNAPKPDFKDHLVGQLNMNKMSGRDYIEGMRRIARDTEVCFVCGSITHSAAECQQDQSSKAIYDKLFDVLNDIEGAVADRSAERWNARPPKKQRTSSSPKSMTRGMIVVKKITPATTTSL